MAREYGFSTDPGAGYLRVPGEEVTLTLEAEFLEQPIQRESLDHHPGLIGARGGTLALTVPVVGCETPGAAGVEAKLPTWTQILLEGAGFGVIEAGIGTVVAASPASTSQEIECVDATGLGPIVMINGEVRLVDEEASTGNRIKLANSLEKGAPTAGTIVYAGVVVLRNDSDPGTLTFVRDYDGGVQYTLTGCKGTLSLPAVNASERARFSFEFQIDNHERTAKVLDSGALSGPKSVKVGGSPFTFNGERIPIRSFEFNPGHEVTAIASTEGANGRSGWRTTAVDPQMTFTPYRADDFRTKYESGAIVPVTFQLGHGEGGTMFVLAGKAQMISYPQEVDAEGLLGHDITVRALAEGGQGAYALVFF